MSLYTELPGFSPVQVTKKTLTSAQLLNLLTTPISLVKGVKGSTIIPLFYKLHYKPGSNPYSSGYPNDSAFNLFPASSISLQWDNGIRTRAIDPGAAPPAPAGELIVVSVCFSPGAQAQSNLGTPAANFDGQDLQIGFGATQQQPLTGGNGTMDVTVVYMVV